MRSGVSARELERTMGRVRRRRTRDPSSPVTDGFVSCTEYAQVDAELSRCSRCLHGGSRSSLPVGTLLAILLALAAWEC
jgi:hypothetical protein